MPEGALADRPGDVLSRAAAHLCALQRRDGSWEGEVVWCTMILSQYVIVRRVTDRPLADVERDRIVQHYAATRTREGGWALHPEGPPVVFTTALAYVALRLLGVLPDHELTARAREWLHRQPEGVLGIPTWGKFWLSLLDLYGASGVTAFPPELFLLPESVPGHPTGWYCHTRYIYVAMSYLAGRGFRADLGPVRDALRSELYTMPYGAIDFSAWRDRVATTDLCAPPGVTLSTARRAMAALTQWAPASWRTRALDAALGRVLREQRRSAYQTLSPVNGLLNCLALHASDPRHPDLDASLAGVEAWRWSDEARGIRYAGARSQVWDTAFAARALVDVSVGAPSPAVTTSLRLAHAYLKHAQILEELRADERDDRDAIRGGWCFSDGAHRWPVSDCTAEALSAVLEVERLPDVIGRAERLPPDRIADALRFLLARQNADGGFSTYERARAGAWLDHLNPSEMFRDCMTDRSYVECTASAIEALAIVRRDMPGVFSSDMQRAMDRAAAFVRASQHPDGAFPSAWGIHFTYGIFHVVKALRAAGAAADDPALVRAAEWLRGRQRRDGGWGEHFSSALERRYVEHPRSQPVMTAWAVLALAQIDPRGAALQRGNEWLASAQSADGSWPSDGVNGVFFGTAMLDYRLYTAYFPVWAIAKVRSV